MHCDEQTCSSHERELFFCRNKSPVTLKIVGLHLEISRDCRNMEINFIGRRSEYVFFFRMPEFL